MTYQWIQDRCEDAKVMIVGEAPGTTEMRDKRPFVGASGYLIDELLSAAGIYRHECFVTNLAHKQPPGNNFEWFTKTKAGFEHLQLGLLKLKDDIEAVKPNLILALGGQPLRYLTGKHGIMDWRGSVLPCTFAPGKVLASYHPSFVLRVPEGRAILEFDLAKAAREQAYPELRYPKREIYFGNERRVRNPERPWEWMKDPDYYFSSADREQMIAEMLAAPHLGTDIENWPWRMEKQGKGKPKPVWVDETGRRRIACISFADRPDRALVFDMTQGRDFNTIAALLASPAEKVLQNGIHDVGALEAEGFTVRNFTFDTMLAHHSCYVECATGEDELSKAKGKKSVSPLRKNLGFLVSIHTDEPRYKDDLKNWKEDNDLPKFWGYNGLDSCCTLEVSERQRKDLDVSGAWNAMNHSMALVPVVMEMTQLGMKVDISQREQLNAFFEQQITELVDSITEGAGQKVNTSSKNDMQWLLYDKLGLTVQRNRKTKAITTDKHALAKLAQTSDNPLLHSILEARSLRTIKANNLDNSLSGDGRIHCNWHISGTKTWRLASSDPNMQNITEDMRKMFVADEGKLLVAADYKQAEAVVVAYLAMDHYLIDLFSDPTRDLHIETGARIFNVALAHVTALQRQIGKVGRHSFNYDASAMSLMQTVNLRERETGYRMTLQQAKHIIEALHLMHPNHRANFFGGVQKSLKADRTVSNAFGFKRIFFGRFDDNMLRSGYAQFPQSTVGVMCCKFLIAARNAGLANPALGWNNLLNVHDAVVGQCYASKVESTVAMLKQAAAIPITVNGNTFTIPVDVSVGSNWAKAGKDGSNPNGLQDYEKWLTTKE